MATVDEISSKLSALINNLSPQARRQLTRNIGVALRKSQQERIARQRNPDGSAFEPRKPQKQFGKKQGRIKRKAMFIKLKTARFLKVRSNDNEVTVGFTGSGAAIANIHQYGLTGTVNKKRGIKVQYAQREVLGFSDEDLEMIENLILEQLTH